MYIDKLDNIANTYNNSHHSTIKVMSVDINSRTYKTLVNTLAIKILNLKLVILLEYQNINTYLQKAMFQIGLKKLLWLKKLKALCRGHLRIVIVKGRHFWNVLRKRIANTYIYIYIYIYIKKSLKLAIKTKSNKRYVKWKDYDSLFRGWINKKDIVLMSEHFPEPKSLGEKVKVGLVSSNYAKNKI